MIIQGQTTSFKLECYEGFHAFNAAYRAADTFMIALYTSAASLDATTTVYTATGEVVGTGYSAGGQTLTVVTVGSSGTTAFTGFTDVTWTAALTARGALIYNSTQGNRAVAVLDFGADKTSVTTLTVQFPTTNATSALIRTT